ncbi:MAG: hypothetical protein ACRCX2_07940 [Paraclostridium sp.]
MVLKKVWIELTANASGDYRGSISKTEGAGIAMYAISSAADSEVQRGTENDIIDMRDAIASFATTHKDALTAQPTPLFFHVRHNTFYMNILHFSINKQIALTNPWFGTAGIYEISECYLTTKFGSSIVAKFTYNTSTIYIRGYPNVQIANNIIKVQGYTTPAFNSIASEPTIDRVISGSTHLTVTPKGYIKTIYQTISNISGVNSFKRPLFVNINKGRLSDNNTVIVTRRQGTQYISWPLGTPSYIGEGGITGALYCDLPQFGLPNPTTTDGSTFLKETVQELTPLNITQPRVFYWSGAENNNYKGAAGFSGHKDAALAILPGNKAKTYAYEIIDGNYAVSKITGVAGLSGAQLLSPKYSLSILNHWVSGGDGTLPTVKILTYAGATSSLRSSLLIPNVDSYLYEKFTVGIYIQGHSEISSPTTIQFTTVRAAENTEPAEYITLPVIQPPSPSGDLYAGTAYFEIAADGINLTYRALDYSKIPEIVAIQSSSTAKRFIECPLTDGDIIAPKKTTTYKLSDIQSDLISYLVISPKKP